MSSCLGIYVQNNLIKYAKISKEHNSFKIDAYGVKFYDSDIEKTIEQIVKETFSYQIPISVNINNEQYTYSDVFNLLKPQDREKAIDTDFDYFCNNNNKNRNSLEYRHIKAPNTEDRDKIRVIYTYVDKANIVEKMQLLDRYKAQSLYPVATVIPTINKTIIQENCAVVNIEKNTEITTIINGAIYKVDKIEQGMGNILSSIAVRENSIQRAYEVCKNTTVYTKTGQNLKIEGNEYLDEIITNLIEIIDGVKEVIVKNGVEINSIYITGMGLIINNIDLLFQENFLDKKCEILVPYFVEKTNVKINIKDYIEVNSAIALAMQALDQKNQEMNFGNNGSAFDKIMKVLTSDVGSLGKSSKGTNKQKINLKQAMNSKLDFFEKTLVRTGTTLIATIIIYIVITEILAGQTNQKIAEADERVLATTTEISKVENYEKLIDARIAEYQKMVTAIDEANSAISENYSSKNAIPNMLNKIMYNIPTGVQLLSVENQTGKNITITAQAEKYDQLGYFKAVLEEEGILTDITTTKGEKKGELISVTITGKLPY